MIVVVKESPVMVMPSDYATLGEAIRLCVSCQTPHNGRGWLAVLDGAPRVCCASCLHTNGELASARLDSPKSLVFSWEQLHKSSSASVTSSSSPASVSSGETNEPQPFLEVLHVIKNSAAWDAGIKKGDLILKFGKYSEDNFEGLKKLADCVNGLGESSVTIMVGRRMTESVIGDTVVTRMRVKKNIKVKPVKWEHGFVLGMVVNVYPPPVSME
jgi:C-terminal processing protease CtpA/Prc